MPGDQIAGCGIAELTAAVVNLAGLHGPRWADPALVDVEGLTASGPEDAAVLAKCLGESQNEGGSTISTAMQRYARLRRSRVARIQRTARGRGRTYHLTGPAAFARDLVISAMGAQRLLARQNWIYDWRE